MKKKALATCLAGTMLLGSVTTSALAVDVNQLVDVEKSDWFYPYVEYVAGKDYMKGISSTQFAPMMEMNRAMFVTVLYRLDNPKGVSSQSNFVDVPSDTWYTQAVNWAAANKIVNGIGGDKFAPDDSITREQICTIVARYVEYRAKKDGKTYKTTEKEKTFPDADQIGEYAKEAVKKCQMWGLIEGNEKGYMNPLNTATRAEVATIVQRLDKMLAGGQSSGGGSVTPPTEKSVNYLMKVSLTGDSSAVGGRTAIFQTPIYSVTSTSDKKFGEVAKDLVAGENKTALSSYIDEAMNGVLKEDKTFTKEVNGQTVEIKFTVEKNEQNRIKSVTISMYTSMNMAGLTKAGGEVRTLAVDQADLETLVEKLQSAQAGSSITLTQTDRDALDKLVEKATEAADWSDDVINEKIAQYKDDNPDLAQVLEGMKPDAIKTAISEYKVELEKIQEQVKDVAPGEEVQITVEQPVTMMVQVDLGEYYDQAVETYNDPQTLKDAIAKVEERLGATFTEAEKDEIQEIYNLNSPEKFITSVEGDKTLKLKTAGEYADLVAANVNAAVDFWSVMGRDADFYQKYLDLLEKKSAPYGVTYAYADEQAVVDILAGGGIFYGVNADVDILTVTGTLDNQTYGNIADKLYEMLTDAGKDSIADLIPMGAAPDILSTLMGNYTLTVTIDKQD